MATLKSELSSLRGQQSWSKGVFEGRVIDHETDTMEGDENLKQSLARIEERILAIEAELEFRKSKEEQKPPIELGGRMK